MSGKYILDGCELGPNRQTTSLGIEVGSFVWSPAHRRDNGEASLEHRFAFLVTLVTNDGVRPAHESGILRQAHRLAYNQGVEVSDGVADESVSIAHVSDVHVGAHDDLALDGLAQNLHDADVAATVVTGDLTMRAHRREFERAKQVIDQFPGPTMIVLGNHDIPLTNPIRRMLAPYDKFRSEITADLDPVLDLGAARILGLQSMPRWRWKSGRVSTRQSDLIRSTFADSPAGVTRVVALHHPPSSRDLETIAGRDQFEAALVDAEVDIVLAGHTHVPHTRTLKVGTEPHARSIVEVVAGTATSHRTRGVERAWSHVRINQSSVTVTTHVDGPDGWVADSSITLSLDPSSHQRN